MTAETLESLRASFNRRLRAEGKADRTLVLYGQRINYFGEFLAQEGLLADLDNLTRDNVLIWLVSLRTRKLTGGTIRTRWRRPHRPDRPRSGLDRLWWGHVTRCRSGAVHRGDRGSRWGDVKAAPRNDVHLHYLLRSGVVIRAEVELGPVQGQLRPRTRDAGAGA
jgi:hypothetical protein